MPAEERVFWGSTLDWGARRRELQEARRDQVIAFIMPELVDGDSVVGVVPQASLYRFGLRMWRSRAVVLTGEWILIVAWDRKTRRCRALEASWRRDLVAAEFLPSYYGDDVIEDRLSLFGPTGTFQRNSQELWVGFVDHAATRFGFSMSAPFSNVAPARTRATRCGPLTARQRSCAAMMSL